MTSELQVENYEDLDDQSQANVRRAIATSWVVDQVMARLALSMFEDVEVCALARELENPPKNFYLEQNQSSTLWHVVFQGITYRPVLVGHLNTRVEVGQMLVAFIFKALVKMKEDLEDCLHDDRGSELPEAVVAGIKNRIQTLRNGIANSGYDHIPQMAQYQDKRDIAKLAPSIVVVTFIFTLGSIIPLSLGFGKVPGDRGSTGDADFYFMIQNALMQVLGFLIFILTLLQNSWHPHLWDWLWVVCFLGIGSALGSIVLYVYTSMGLGFLFSFIASGLQACMALLSMYAVVAAYNRR
ncbi:hypothetical protein F4680DRAFT_290204 [Xylaria scruposa]|nr:hypothetical protein F4680DRAFT_290204 [Xylaria scruposa]